MAYGVSSYWGTHGKSHEEAGMDRAMESPAMGRTADPALVAERKRIQGMMADLAHVTPTGELVTFASEPFGDKIRMLSRQVVR